MARKRGYLLHCGILPHNDLVQRVAVRAHQLVVRLREDEVADLRPRVDAIQRIQIDRVPESNALVCRAAASREEASVQWRPVDCLHSCLMLGEFHQRLSTGRRPDEQLIVVASGGELVLVVQTPSESTDLLTVVGELHVTVGGRTQVSHENCPVLAAGGYDRGGHVVPGEGAHPAQMALQRPDFLLFIDVPNLNLSGLRTNAQMIAFVGPTERSHLIEIAEVTQFRHGQRGGIPNIHRRFKCHCKDVLRGPVDQIQVEIITKSRCIQYTIRITGYFPWFDLTLNSLGWVGHEQVIVVHESIIQVQFRVENSLSRLDVELVTLFQDALR